MNDPFSARALWVKFTIYSPKIAERNSRLAHTQLPTVAEAWAIAFDHTAGEELEGERGPRARHVAVKETVPISSAQLAYEPPFAIHVSGASFDGKRLKGSVKLGDSEISFDIELQSRDGNALVHYPHPKMYSAPFPKTKIVSPIVDALAQGEIRVRDASGERHWKVDNWPAMQGHNWGTAHADLYAWGHCNVWHEPEGKDVVFEGFSAKVKVGPLRSPMLSVVAVRYRGVRYEIQSVLEIAKVRGDIGDLRRWQFFSRQAGAEIEGSFSLRDDDVVGLYYPNPDGQMTYCLNSKLARATLRFAPHQRPPVVLTSDAAALEIATHDANHGIRMYV